MAGKLPAFQFYTGDWLKDPELSVCTVATRGIWIDLLCRMHEASRSGIVRGSLSGLAASCRCSEDELRAALVDLARSRTADVTIEDHEGVRDLSEVCPRFVRDLSAVFPGGRHTFVTVVNRRMKREADERAKAAERKALERERKARERAETKGGHGKVTRKSRPLSSSSPSGKKQKTTSSGGSSPQQAMFGALAKACYPEGHTLTDQERGRVAKAAQGLRNAGVEATEIPSLAETYRAKYPDFDLTPTAIAANLGNLRKGIPPTRPDPDGLVQCGPCDPNDPRLKVLDDP